MTDPTWPPVPRPAGIAWQHADDGPTPARPQVSVVSERDVISVTDDPVNRRVRLQTPSVAGLRDIIVPTPATNGSGWIDLSLAAGVADNDARVTPADPTSDRLHAPPGVLVDSVGWVYMRGQLIVDAPGPLFSLPDIARPGFVKYLVVASSIGPTTLTLQPLTGEVTAATAGLIDLEAPPFESADGMAWLRKVFATDEDYAVRSLWRNDPADPLMLLTHRQDNHYALKGSLRTQMPAGFDLNFGNFYFPATPGWVWQFKSTPTYSTTDGQSGTVTMNENYSFDDFGRVAVLFQMAWNPLPADGAGWISVHVDIEQVPGSWDDPGGGGGGVGS